MGIPLELVKYSVEDGKFSVGTGALEVLKKVHAPLGVVAVCGRARQGKSYILNRLLKQAGKGFVVGPTHRPCTKGLWMWSEPQPRVNPDGSQHYLVLLDTEGIDAWDQTAQYSTQIFSLAVLLSSLFVYNQMGGIDESALDRLSLVTEMTKHIRVKAGGGNERLGDFTPSFLWLLRDFYLKLEDEGVKVTPKDYLETALLPVSGSGASVQAKNGIRASIKALFPDRDCFTVVRPMNDEAQLVNLDNVDPAILRPEFREGVAQLIELIFSKAEPKRFGTQFMTGPVLAGLVEAYVEALNNGAVPTIATAWQGVAEQESRRAADTAESVYALSFNTDTVAEEEALVQEHERCVELALIEFKNIAVGDPVIQAAHEAKFRQAVKARFSDVKGRKLAEAASAVNEMLYKATINITQAARSGSAGLEEVQAQISTFVEQYAAMASGPTKWQRLAEFLKDTYGATSQELLTRADRAGKQALEQANSHIQALRQELAEVLKRAEAAEKRAEAAEKRAEAASFEAVSLKEAGGRQARDAGELKARAEAAEIMVAALESQIKEKLDLTENMMRSTEAQAEARVKKTEIEAEIKISELQVKLTEAKAMNMRLEGDSACYADRVTSLQGMLESQRKDADNWRGKYAQVVQDLATVVKERDAAAARAAAQSSEARQLEDQKLQVQAHAARLESELRGHSEMRSQLQQRLDELITEAQAARARAALAGPPAFNAALQQMNKMSNSNGQGSVNVGGSADTEEGLDQGEKASDSGAAAVAAAEEALSRMTVMEIKEWLTQQGHAEQVWTFQSRRPVPKRADWVELIKQVSAVSSQ